MDGLKPLQLFDILKLLPAVQEEVESQTFVSLRVSRRTGDWEFGHTGLWSTPLFTPFFPQLLHFCVTHPDCKSFTAQFRPISSPLPLFSNITKDKNGRVADSTWTFWCVISTSTEPKTCSRRNTHAVLVSKSVNQVDISQMNTLQYTVMSEGKTSRLLWRSMSVICNWGYCINLGQSWLCN